MRYLLTCFYLFFAVISFSQKANVITAEDQEFYRVAKLTKEFKKIMQVVDSVNEDENKVPQEYKFWIKKDSKPSTDRDSFLFGELTRRSAMGFMLEHYTIKYDRLNKKIISVAGGVQAEIK